MSFEAVAKKVIKNSIRSAICIDDTYASAYSSDKKLEHDEPRKLYESFREVGQCDLDIYHFKSLSESWKKDYMIPNKDLMILDWELEPNFEPKYKDTLKILSDVVKSNQIPFVVIYTSASDLSEISRILFTEFNLISKSFDRVALFDKLNDNFNIISNDKDDVDFESFFDDVDNIKLFFDYLYNYERRDEIKEDILERIIEDMSLKPTATGVYAKLGSVLRHEFPESNNYVETLSLIGLSLGKSIDCEFNIEKVETVGNILKINNTTVLIYHKSVNGEGVKPEALFDNFSKAIISNPHNYLSLLSLELKDQLRKEFSKIGAKFSKIDEKAFFYHMQNFRNEGGASFDTKRIYDFVIKSWLQDLSAQTLNGKSYVIELIEDRMTYFGDIPTELNKQEQEELIKYSAFISTSDTEPIDERLKFGDIIKNGDNDDYFLCITPHCDCVHPEEKIKSNFYFTKGTVVKGKKTVEAIENAEKGYYSFLNIDSEAVCIEWLCKPFTAHILYNNINELKFCYLSAEVSFQHITTLKENFAQRISNESFGKALRVGIDLPHS